MKQYKIQKLILTISAAVTLIVAGCSSEKNNSESSSGEVSASEPYSAAAAKTENTDKEESTDSPTETERPTEEKTEASTQFITAGPMTYREVLEGIYYDDVYPNGYNCGYDDFYDKSVNKFAVYDIDNDGSDELIVVYTTTYVAGNVEYIYDHDENGYLIEEFRGFPLFIYYDNGIIKVGISHNQGLAGSFWPYTLYQYDPQSDSYNKVGFVDAWDKSYTDTDFYHDDAPFPDNIDVSETGFVYYICANGSGGYDDPVDVTEYNAWHDSYVVGASEVELPFMNMTEENIQSVDQ